MLLLLVAIDGQVISEQHGMCQVGQTECRIWNGIMKSSPVNKAKVIVGSTMRVQNVNEKEEMVKEHEVSMSHFYLQMTILHE